MRLAVIGDIHLYRLWAAPWRLFGKRILGQANLWLNRRYKFGRSLLPPVLDKVRAIEPDMALFSGDLTTTALPGELADAADAVRGIAEQCPVAVVPGNHDRYTFASARSRAMEKAFGELMPAAFPLLRPLTGPWHLLQIDSAVPRAISSRGRVGKDQLQKVQSLLAGLNSDQGVIVLCHYALGCPPERKPMKPNHQLEDEQALLDVLQRCMASVIYIHGHVHVPWRWNRFERLIDLNAGSPCLHTEKWPAGQGLWQVQLPDDTAALERVEMARHYPTRQDDQLIWSVEAVQ